LIRIVLYLIMHRYFLLLYFFYCFFVCLCPHAKNKKQMTVI
jgi:hypothetical protein